MKTCDLTVRPTKHAQRDSHAWHLHSADTGRLFDALRAMTAKMGGVRLLLVPRSRSDISLLGFVIWHDNGALPDPPAGCESYGLIADRLFLPTHARLGVALTDDELRAALVHYWAVYHPAVGFIGYGEQEVLTPYDLFELPTPRDGGWHSAVTVPPINDRLRSMRPQIEPIIEDILRAGGDDIGSKQSGDMPPMADEPSDSAAAKFGRGVKGTFGKIVHGLAGGENAPGLTRGMAQWAAGLASGAAQANDFLRNREIHRLLDMLSRNPLEGLRHAIPFGGEAARGVAPPSNTLGTNNPSFSLGGLAGGGPTDYWEIEREQQNALLRRYRELAIAEAQRGNHRRAAYIYANLMGDLHSAATVLETGGYYREAAVIFRDRLDLYERAAKCLENGGLLAEAAELYEQRDKWLKAASIYERLSDDPNARRCYRNEVNARLSRSDRLAAAQLQEEKLRDVKAAITTLYAAWPDHAQAEKCLVALYALLNRTGAHERARQLTAELIPHSHSDAQTATLVSVLAGAGRDCADRNAGDWMHDQVLIVASTLLGRGCTETVANKVTAAVAVPHADDKLLRRDGRRFTDKMLRSAKSAKVEDRQDHKDLSPESTWQLPSAVQWYDVKVAGNSLISFGMNNDGHHIVRRTPSNPLLTHNSVDFMQVPHHERIRFADGACPDHQRVIWFGEGQPIADIRFAGTDELRPLTLYSPDWLRGGHSVVAHGLGQTLVGFDMFLNAVEVYHREGGLRASYEMPPEIVQHFVNMPVDEHDWVERARLCVSHHTVYLYLAGAVVCVKDGQWTFLLEEGEMCHDMVAIHPTARCRFALTHSQGATLVHDGLTDVQVRKVAADMIAPRACFTHRRGHLVLVDDEECRVYETLRGTHKLIAKAQLNRPTPVAVVGWPDGDRFVTLAENGEMRCYRVP